MRNLNNLRVVFGAAFIALILWLPIFGQNAVKENEDAKQEYKSLATGERVERRILKGEKHVYSLALKRGEIVHITVEQRGVNVTVAIAKNNAEGKILEQADEARAADGVEDFIFLADAGGEYLFGVFAFEPSTPEGAYVLQNTAPFSAAEEKKIAEYLVKSGSEAFQKNDFELAVIHHENAVNLLGKQPASLEFALALFSLGNDYFTVKNYAKAIETYGKAAPVFHQFGDKENEAFVLHNAAIGSFNNKDYEKSVNYYQKARGRSTACFVTFRWQRCTTAKRI